MISGLRYFVFEAFESLWRNRRSSTISILTISIALFMLGLFLLVSENLGRTVGRVGPVGRNSRCTCATRRRRPSDRPSSRRCAPRRQWPAWRQYRRTRRWRGFRRDFPDLAPATAGEPANPFPASFEVRLGPSAADPPALAALAARVGAMPGVADVRYDRRWLDRLASLGRAVRWTGLLLAAILVLAAGLTVANVVRLALYARRDEVEIMELVGAPMAFIRGPFICEGVIQGGLGAVVALVLLRVVFGLGQPRLASIAAGVFDATGVVFLPGATMALVLLGGMAVGCLGGLVAARRLR